MLEDLDSSASIVHYLGAFDLFPTLFFPSGPAFPVLFPHHDHGLPSRPRTHPRPRPRTTNGPKLASEHPASNSLKHKEKGHITYTLISHITHTHAQDVRPIEKSERLTDHHQIEASIHSRDTGLGRLQASTLHCFSPPTLQRLLRSEPGGSFRKVGNTLRLN